MELGTRIEVPWRKRIRKRTDKDQDWWKITAINSFGYNKKEERGSRVIGGEIETDPGLLIT